MVTYPRGELDERGMMLRRIGSFWTYQYEDPEFLEMLYRAEADDYEQQYQLFLDLQGCLSRENLPVYQRKWWYPLVLRQSDLGSVDTALIQYGQSGLAYGGGENYGDQRETERYLYPLDGDIVRIRLLSNRMSGATSTWVAGINYQTGGGYIEFRADPFTSGAFAVRPVYDLSGNLVDQEVLLWAFSSDLDKTYIWSHIGYVVGQQFPSGEYYKKFVNALWDMHSWGPTTLGLRKAVAAASGIGLAEVDGEIVKRVYTDTALNVITDKAVYQFDEDAVATVADGDVLAAGDTLSDVVQFTPLYENNPDLTPYAGITMGSGLLQGEFLGGLHFRNEETALEYLGEDEDGYVEVRFEISGFPLDIMGFWERVHARGKVDGQTLAHLLDTRDGGNGEPQPQNLPATVNPMEIVFELLGANYLLVRIKTSLMSTGAVGMQALGALRNVMPPNVATIFYLEIAVAGLTQEYTSVVPDSPVIGYSVDVPSLVISPDSPAYTYVMVDGDFVLVGTEYVVIGSGVTEATPNTYGVLAPTVRQTAIDCGQ